MPNFKDPFSLSDRIASIASSITTGSGPGVKKADKVALDRKRVKKIKGGNWDKNLRYYFAKGTASEKDGTVRTVSTPKSTTVLTNPETTDVFELFLNPNNISISTPFSSNVTATNRGVIEENNGVVFRMIQISGTTGVLPGRDGQAANKPSTLQQIFPAASQAIQAIGSLSKLATSIFGNSSQTPNALGGNDDEIAQALRETGYYQFWALNNWLIEYAEGKKRASASSQRLLFCSPKDSIAYVCTPVSFDLRRDASQPMLYRYSIVLKCWDIAVSSVPGNSAFDDSEDQQTLSVRGVLNRIRKARKAILSASNVIKGVQSDVGDIFQIVNQTVLAAKDVVGVSAEAIDFLPTLKNNANLIAKNTYDQFSVAVSDLEVASFNLVHIFDRSPEAGTQDDQGGGGNGSLGAASSGASLGGEVGAGVGVAGQAVAAKKSSSSTTSKVSPTGEKKDTNDVSNNAKGAYVSAALDNTEVVDQLSMDDIQPLPKQIQAEIDRQTQTAQETTQGTAKIASSKLQEIANNMAYANGSMHPDYALAYGLPPVRTADREITEDDILLAADLQDGKEALDEGQAYSTLFNGAGPDPFVTANQILPSDEKLASPVSGFPVTVDQGQTLGDIALIHLGDANRGREIAIFNGLRSPYLDEDGFSLPITQASHHSFAVTDASKLAVNQYVQLQGSGVAGQRGRITNIEPLGASFFRITVDGTTLLDSFLATSNPYLTARLPGTIGSGDIILIPSSEAADQNLTEKKTALTERLSYAERVFKVDLLLGADGDIVIAPGGDIARSYGYTNAIQAIRILLETEVGELDQHQNFGLVATIGGRTSDANVNDFVEQVRSSILSDPRYSDSVVTATLQGSVVRIRVEAQGAGGTGLIPVEFEVGL
jgi:hypothetical protein